MIDNYVFIDWVAPFNGGSQITAYKVFIRQSENIFSQDLIDCDGTDLAIVSGTSCTVPLDSLTSSPYSLSLGVSIDVKVIASNYFGDS